ncbi:hypothetical protein PQX77_016233 [Marasmius sp. AFHP31]|nr:hypothetical protein PQX77_016233 [Marasmius sp. AFHP31]
MIFRFAPFDQATVRDVKMALASEALGSSLLQFVGIAPTLIVVRTGLGVAIQDVNSSSATKHDPQDDTGRLSEPTFAPRESVPSHLGHSGVDLEAYGKGK